MKKYIVLFTIISIIYVTVNIFLFGYKLSDTRIDLYKYILIDLKESIHRLNQDIKRYPTTKEGLMFLCKNVSNEELWKGPYQIGLCEMNIKNVIYFNINEEIILYHVGTNGINEYTFGDDVRESLPYDERNNQKRIYIFLFNGVFFGFLIGNVFRCLLSRSKRK